MSIRTHVNPDEDTTRSAEIGGKYRVLFELGHGGAATVHLAVARGASGFNKLVVLKIPRSSVASDPAMITMFLDEARLSARLSHPNVVQTNEITEDRGLPIMVMEYLEGKPLSEVMSRTGGRVPMRFLLRILIDALTGLHYAHEATDFDGSSLSIVHRDMTPHNIFVTFTGQVKILDFGIAKLDRARDKTETGIIKGKIRYMPPEQIAGEAVDARTDVYAVGVMLWEAAAGKPIFQGEREREILNRVLNDEVPTPSSQTDRAVDPELERIIMRALSAEPDARYPSAAALQADLEKVLESEPGRATHREVGEFIVQSFQDEKTATRRRVEEMLRDRAVQSWSESASTTTASISRTGAKARSSRASWLVALGIALVAAAAVLLWRRPAELPRPAASVEPDLRPAATDAPTAAASTSGSPAAASAAPPVEAASVTLRIDVRPPTAKVFVDGAEVASPSLVKVKKDDVEHTIRAEARGYVPASKVVRFAADQDVHLALDPARGPTHAAPTAAVKPPAPDCNPPYVIDAKGIKTFKPNCLR